MVSVYTKVDYIGSITNYYAILHRKTTSLHP